MSKKARRQFASIIEDVKATKRITAELPKLMELDPMMAAASMVPDSAVRRLTAGGYPETNIRNMLKKLLSNMAQVTDAQYRARVAAMTGQPASSAITKVPQVYGPEPIEAALATVAAPAPAPVVAPAAAPVVAPVPELPAAAAASFAPASTTSEAPEDQKTIILPPAAIDETGTAPQVYGPTAPAPSPAGNGKLIMLALAGLVLWKLLGRG